MKSIRILFSALAFAFASLASAATIHIPDAFLASYLQGGGNLSTATVKCGLITVSSYNQATTTVYSGLTEVTGTGYTAGGQTATVSVTADTTNHWTTITITPAVWSGATTISATGAACYDSTNGNKVIAIDDFGATVASSGGTYTVGAITLKFTHF